MNQSKKQIMCRWGYSLFAVFLVSFCKKYMIEKIEDNQLIKIACYGVSLLILLGCVYHKQAQKIFHAIIKYRWLIAAGIFLICVGFRVHGSSMEMYNNTFLEQSDEKAAKQYHVVGKYRDIRSDEWMVQTPLYFSQKNNDYKFINERISMSGMNMVLSYYAPVKDITVIGKPFSWGYLIGGNAFGLSWYWCSMMIALFMTSFEMFMILTKKNARLSLVGMTMIGFSPVMQWWFVPHIPIVFIMGMGLFDIGYHFFTAKTNVLKWLMSALAAVFAIGFALSIFPSCQIIAAISMVLLLIVCLYRDRDEITFTWKQWPRLAIPLVFVGVVILSFLVRSKDALEMLMNTTYPGKRISLGGDEGLYGLFTNLTSPFLAYKNSNVLNNSEVATYIHFAPFFMAIFPILDRRLQKLKEKEAIVGETLWYILMVQAIFMCAGFPKALSKITFFSYVNRMQISYGWIGVIFTIWCVYIIWKHGEIFKTWEKIVYPVLYGAIYFTFITKEIREYIGLRYLTIEILLFVAVLLFALCVKKHMFGYLVVGIMCFTGMLVNPINRGIAPITNHPISKCIEQEVKKNPDAVWVSLDTQLGYIGNFVMANGAKVIDGTNFYPDFDKWKILDPEKKYYKCYNRYNNQTFNFSKDVTSIRLVSPDHVECHISLEDLQKLDVEYIVTQRRGLEDDFAGKGVQLEKIFDRGGYLIYRWE